MKIDKQLLDSLGIESIQAPDTNNKAILDAWYNIVGLTVGAYNRMIAEGINKDIAKLIVSNAVIWKDDSGK